jgi:riboflavin biosynthesis pyrimidine reductase
MTITMSTPIGPGSPFTLLFDQGAGAGPALPASFLAIYGGDWRTPAPGAARPYLYMNFVVSRDGRVSFNEPGHMGGGDISMHNRHDQWLMGLMRARADAIMVGAATLRVDPRHIWTAEQIYPDDAAAFTALRKVEQRAPTPLQVFVSGSGELPPDLAAFERADLHAIIATTSAGAARARRSLPHTGQVDILDLGDGQLDFAALMHTLRDEHGVATLLCEGGSRIYGALIQAGVVDDEFLTLSPIVIGSPPDGAPRPTLVEGVAFAPGAAPRQRTISLRRAGDHLFLRSSYER